MCCCQICGSIVYWHNAVKVVMISLGLGSVRETSVSRRSKEAVCWLVKCPRPHGAVKGNRWYNRLLSWQKLLSCRYSFLLAATTTILLLTRRWRSDKMVNCTSARLRPCKVESLNWGDILGKLSNGATPIFFGIIDIVATKFGIYHVSNSFFIFTNRQLSQHR